ncbi:MAG: retroviral-like aspartic protease family protein [Desulfobacterota bacterium]|nr:retroviral-like aspartic protease family protein [Thermodesulfobacteriota bacterium]
MRTAPSYRGSIIYFLPFLIFILSASSANGEMYRWVDEKGTLHFADDLSKVPERYRSEAEMRKTPKGMGEASPVKGSDPPKTSPPASLPPPVQEPQGFEVPLHRKHELWLTEVILNGRWRQYFVVDTGASFTLISRQTANELGITINETTPFLRVTSVSDVILTPLVNLRSVRVGKAEVENVDALVYTMPTYQGLLGNSFLNKFKVVIDALNSKMMLYSMQGTPSPERPGGFSKEYWVGQFRFYLQNLEDLKRLKAYYEQRGSRSELTRVNNAILYFENQLSELERRASFAGVPRNWRE